MGTSQPFLNIKGARVHNLKNVSLKLPKESFIVFTGLSGSGKSSLAFDTIYAEGQRRYAESLSSYARQFMEIMDKPDLDEMTGLSPTIAIDQRSSAFNPRSTVGTVTELYDLLRLLFTRIGMPHCPQCGKPVTRMSKGQIVEAIRSFIGDGETFVLAPFYKQVEHIKKTVLQSIEQTGADTIRLDGMLMSLHELRTVSLSSDITHDVDVVVARLCRGAKINMVEVVERALEWGNGTVTVLDEDGNEHSFSERLACSTCGIQLPPLSPRLFSFNSPHGACPRCTGLGVTQEVDAELVIPNARLTLAEGAVQPWMRITGNQQWYHDLLTVVAKVHDFSMNTPVEKLSKKIFDVILYGTDGKTYTVAGKETIFEGVVPNLIRRHTETDSEYVRREIEQYMRERLCSVCKGKRLRQEALSVLVLGNSIADVVLWSVEKTLDFVESLSPGTKNGLGSKKTAKKEDCDVGALVLSAQDKTIAQSILKEMKRRLDDLLAVGLGYLTVDRPVTSLSGGEVQRVRLSTQLSTGLTGVIYILDEPSIGLHPRDNKKLIDSLKGLRDLGNTVIVVEHDEDMMRAADMIVDIGPGAGVYGGEILVAGTLNEIIKAKNSLTGKYLSGKESIDAPKKVRRGNGKKITVKGSRGHNLKNVTVDFPLGTLSCVTGVSGSGKSTLVIDTLSAALNQHFYRAKTEPAEHDAITGISNVDKVIAIDQSPIGRTPRSNPATYTGVFTLIRDCFTAVPEARARGYDAGKFSFNVKGGGRCEACAGEGYVRIPMQFLTDVFVECNDCQGKRYSKEVLEIHYNGKAISDVLNMTVEEAYTFFRGEPAIADKLQVLRDVGLGYMALGQPATTLSGGEAQRVKLATELSRRATGKTLYILDEPTTGLHFEDIKRLLYVLDQLVEKGNTVVVIEHNMDVIKSADWVIDMGPEGGDEGGEVVAEGVPKDVAKNKKSYTGLVLKKILSSK
ncbi:MAG TPA: excinuclease ABC subunit UvrA [Candidatus Magasanikbacteria bacterium]|nr:excinuclease ABC subunit UvrA [Candidatus Magasanikbacteria bacterium]